MKLQTYIVTAVLIAMLSSCSSSKKMNDLVYFHNIDSIGAMNVAVKNLQKIIVGDELKITVSSSVPEATAHFNAPVVSVTTKSETNMSSQTSSLQTYIVDENGNINFPELGKIQVLGKTTSQVREMLEERIGHEVKEPFVNVYLTEYRVNVLGEVKEPGTQLVKKERYTVLDAIADAGDITVYGHRNNILVIREENGEMVSHRLNLQDANSYKSPYFYLQQNDVVYVEPNKIQRDNSKYNQNNAFKLSVVSAIISASSVIASLVIALAVK